MENLAFKKSAKKGNPTYPNTYNGFRPESAIRSNKRLMMNYAIMLKNRQEYNNYKIMDSIK
jgi:hypothetical protein